MDAVTGVITEHVTTQVTVGTIKVKRTVFSLDTGYLLSDFAAQFVSNGVSNWHFDLPTAMWVDGVHTLSVTPLLGNNKTKGTPASVNVTLQNGVTTPPTNTNTFTPTAGRTPQQGAPFIVAAVGDGAAGSAAADRVVSLIQSWNPNLFLYLADVYERGTYTEFFNWYAPSWGQLYSITDPTVGNHEVETPNGDGYARYWGLNGVQNGPLYYSFDTQGWHFISLDGNPFKNFPQHDDQMTWLQNDLTQHADQCIVAYWHQPLFDEGPAGGSSQVQGLWNQLVAANATLVLNGHDHSYQRWEPLDASGTPDATGITEIIVGTGGHEVQKIHNDDPRVVKAVSGAAAAGALSLTLTPAALSFAFTKISAAAPADSGTIACRAPPAVTAVSPAGGSAGGLGRVVISGSHLSTGGPVQGTTYVSFGTTQVAQLGCPAQPASPCFTVDSDTQITAYAPPGTGAVDVTVTTPNGTSAAAAADQYTYS